MSEVVWLLFNHTVTTTVIMCNVFWYVFEATVSRTKISCTLKKIKTIVKSKLKFKLILMPSCFLHIAGVVDYCAVFAVLVSLFGFLLLIGIFQFDNVYF